MKDHVMIKSSSNGLILTLDNDLTFEDLKTEVLQKFKENEAFFGKSKFAISFKGKTLSEEQEQELVFLITQNTKVQIICILEDDEKQNEKFKDAVEQKEKESLTRAEGFYRGTLRSGQILETEHSVVILGDVNPGGKVISKGNIVVLGSLRGTAYAGAAGNEECFVAATNMDPIQIKIGEVIGRKSDGLQMHRKVDKNTVDPIIATVENGTIAMSVVSKGSIMSI